MALLACFLLWRKFGSKQVVTPQTNTPNQPPKQPMSYNNIVRTNVPYSAVNDGIGGMKSLADTPPPRSMKSLADTPPPTSSSDRPGLNQP